MKKRIIILILSAVILISLLLYYIESNNDSSVKNIEISIKRVENVQNSPQNIADNDKKEKISKKTVEKIETGKFNIVKRIGDVEQKYVDEAEQELLKLPQKLVQTFIQNGWEIYITTENIAQVYCEGKFGNSVRGVTIYSKKKIIIEDRNDIIKSTLIHEFGHYLDHINNFPSLDNEFKQIYNEELNDFKSNISNSGCVFEERELFAEVFYYSIIDPSKCTPKALDYVQSFYDI